MNDKCPKCGGRLFLDYDENTLACLCGCRVYLDQPLQFLGNRRHHIAGTRAKRSDTKAELSGPGRGTRLKFTNSRSERNK